MKIKDRGHDHVIHLPTQVVAWLKTLPKGKGAFLFPGRMGADTVTSESVSKAMRGSRWECATSTSPTVPALRSRRWRPARWTRSTSALPFCTSEWTEAVLDHLTGNAVNDAYMRGKLFQRGRQGFAMVGRSIARLIACTLIKYRVPISRGHSGPLFFLGQRIVAQPEYPRIL